MFCSPATASFGLSCSAPPVGRWNSSRAGCRLMSWSWKDGGTTQQKSLSHLSHPSSVLFLCKYVLLMQAQTELCHSLQLPQGRITFTLLNASFQQNTEWSQKTAFDKEERDFKTNNPHSLTCIQIQTRGTVVKKKNQPNPLTFLLQAAFITERTGFILAVTFPFDGVFWVTSPHVLCSVGDPVSCRCILC